MFGWLNRKSRGMSQVKQLMKAGEFEVAAQELDELAASYPADTDVALHRAVCLRELERYEDALADIQRIHSKYVQDSSVWELLGSVLFHLKRFPEAVAPLTRALELDSRRQVARHFRATSLFMLQRNREAMEDCLEYIENWPTDFNGYYLKAALHEAMWQLDAGLDAAEQGLGFDRQNANLLTVKARLLCYAERPAEALSTMDTAIAAGANADGLSVLRAFQLVNVGRFAEAIPYLDGFIREAHGRGCYLKRAAAYEGLGQHAKALADRQAASRILEQLLLDVQKTGVVRTVILIQVESTLFEPGEHDAGGLVLLTFDNALNDDPDRLFRLACALSELKLKPLGANPILRQAASAFSNDYGQDHRRQPIPLELTDNAQCYAADLCIYRDYLPGRQMAPGTQFLSVIAEPGDIGRIELIPFDGSPAAGRA